MTAQQQRRRERAEALLCSFPDEMARFAPVGPWSPDFDRLNDVCSRYLDVLDAWADCEPGVTREDVVAAYGDALNAWRAEAAAWRAAHPVSMTV